MEPNYLRTLYNFSLCYQKLGNIEKAKEYLQLNIETRKKFQKEPNVREKEN